MDIIIIGFILGNPMDIIRSMISYIDSIDDKWMGFNGSVLGAIVTIMASVYLSNYADKRDKKQKNQIEKTEKKILLSQLKKELNLVIEACEIYSDKVLFFVDNCKSNVNISIFTVDSYVTIYPQIISRVLQLRTSVDQVVFDAFLKISMNSKDFISTLTPSKLQFESNNCIVFQNVNKKNLLDAICVYKEIIDISKRAIEELEEIMATECV